MKETLKLREKKNKLNHDWKRMIRETAKTREKAKSNKQREERERETK